MPPPANGNPPRRKLAFKRWLTEFVERRWYGRPGLLYFLWPLECLFKALASGRRRRQQRDAYKSSLPLVIVGNLSVGGTGKTPLLIALGEYLRHRGYRPAVISRAYKSRAARASTPMMVGAQHSYRDVGDEPLEIHMRTGLPVAVGADRVQLLQFVERETDCDVILADDGLQNYRLARHIEIVVIDGLRGWGNGHCLPVGPLREPPQRARQATFCLLNGDGKLQIPGRPLYRAQVRVARLSNLLTGQQLPLEHIAQWQRVVAVAGMGNPEKLFNTLGNLLAEFERRVFPDHGEISAEDLAQYRDHTVIMSGKDAVKCREFARANFWVLEIDLVPETLFLQRFLGELEKLSKRVQQ